MTYNTHKLNELSAEFMSMYNGFKDKYDTLKQSTVSGDSIVWCKGWTEPFNSDFITEISDNTTEEWKVLKKMPLKKEYASEHHFINNTAVYSAFYGEAGKLSAEKFFIIKEKTLTGLMFSDTKKLYSITLEVFDDFGKTIEYNLARIDEAENIVLNSRCYHYEENYIINAEEISGFKIGMPIMFYNNPIYENIGLVLTSDIQRMNPELVADYTFVYNDNGVADMYTRTNYSYGKITKHTWKMKKSMLKKYSEYNINCFFK